MGDLMAPWLFCFQEAVGAALWLFYFLEKEMKEAKEVES
jgi:hypothetical protein